MASNIDITLPVQGSPTTESVRANFAAAKDEILALQTDVSGLQTSKANLAGPALTGTATAVNLTVSGTLNATGTLQVNGVAVTSTAAELNALDGFTGVVADLNYAKDLRATNVTTTQFGYLVGVTSAIQTQLNAKAGTSHTHAAADVTSGTFANARISEGSVTQHQTAINAGKVDGKDIAVVSSLPGSPDANTIYFVTT